MRRREVWLSSVVPPFFSLPFLSHPVQTAPSLHDISTIKREKYTIFIYLPYVNNS